jgi:DNA-binding NtrC family response regulator
MQAKVLLVSDDAGLSRSRLQLLKQWEPVVVTSADAPHAIEISRYDLLILCQTIRDDVAAALAEHMAVLYPHAKVMTISNRGRIRGFGTVQCTVNVTDPTWLPKAVAHTLSARNS